MTDDQPHAPVAEPYLGGAGPCAAWATATAELQRSATFWLATLHPAGRPHIVPVLAVVDEAVLHVAAGPQTQKARNPATAVTTHGDSLDVVLEGTARRIADDARLRRVAQAYASEYGWDVQAHGGALHGQGAPTAGPPPYYVYRLLPRRGFGFPTDDRAPPTRWTCPPPALDGHR